MCNSLAMLFPSLLSLHIAFRFARERVQLTRFFFAAQCVRGYSVEAEIRAQRLDIFGKILILASQSGRMKRRAEAFHSKTFIVGAEVVFSFRDNTI